MLPFEAPTTACAAGRMSDSPDISVVVPVFNSMRFLPHTVPPLLASGRSRKNVEFIFVDNGSSDGSREYLQSLGDDVHVYHRPGLSISALRNHGAQAARGEYLSFIDSDCRVGAAYFVAAIADLEESGASATGHEYDIPEPAGWIESAWHHLHYRTHACDVQYLNGGNFFVQRRVFERIGGFREDLWTGEDAELGQRWNAAGERIHGHPAVRAVHLGNPKSLRQFYRRQVWHGVGMLGTAGKASLDKPTVMMALHLVASGAGLWLLVLAPLPLLSRTVAAIALQLIVPAMTVAFRLARQRRVAVVLPGLLLYWLYYWARVQAMSLIVSGRARHYRK